MSIVSHWISRLLPPINRRRKTTCTEDACVQILEDRLLLTLNIAFDYRYDTTGFFSSQQRRDVLEAAASTFEERITDDLTAITPGGSNSWNAVFINPTTNVQVTLPNLTVPADTIIVFPGARNLPSGLGLGGPGGFNGGGSATFLNNLQTRGEAGVNPSGTNDTDFALWGGTIAFDNAVTWNFSVDAPVAGQNDLFSVALHELAHVLGFGTSDSFTNKINSSNRFTGTEAVAAFGGTIPMREDQAGNLDQGHYADNTTGRLPGTQIEQESAMDPQVTTGTRKLLTDIDWGALDDLGWDVTPVQSAAGNVDGDSDFDSNDSFLIQLVMLAASNQQIDDSKGSSSLSAADIRTAVNGLQTAGDVDGDGQFDANDAFLIHLVKLAGQNSQIDQFKGSSSLTAAQIRTNVDALGGGSPASGRGFASGNPVLAAVYADVDLSANTAVVDQSLMLAIAEDTAATDVAFAADDFRNWLAAVGF